MRAVAVLAVFADHLFGWPPGGFVGVDVFFVLSGFFITGLLIRERATTGQLSFQDFYIRRVKRILPSALLVLVVTVIGAYLLFPASRAKDTLLDALYAAVFAANFRFEAVGADYFQQGQPPSPVQHYWSLSIEEQFYFVWPVLLVLIFGLTRQISRRGKPRARQWGLFGTMSMVVAASFAWAMLASANDPNSAYFSTFTRIWELGVGALVAISGQRIAQIPSVIRPVLAYLGLTGVAASLFLIDSTVQFPAPWAALPVLSTALLVISFHGAEVHGMYPLTNRVVRYLGDTSYTLYLWHWPVIILLLNVFPKGPLFYSLVLIVTLGLTAGTYHFYENPIRKSSWLLGRASTRRRWRATLRTPSWATIGVLMVALLVVSILKIQYDDKLSAAPQDEPSTPIDLSAPGDPCFGAQAMVTQGCALRDPEKPLKPSVDEFSRDLQGADKCWRGEGKALETCTFGYQGEHPTARIALVGDSHAQVLLPVLWPYLVENRWQLTTYLGFKCQWRISPSPSDCPIDEIQAKLLARPYDLVLTTANRNTLPPPTPTEYQQAWEPIAAAGSRVAVLADNPAVSEDSIACLTRVSFGGGDRTGDCGTPRAVALAQIDPLIAATDLVPTAKLIDLTSYYCTADRCPTVIGNVIVYRDAVGHLTATYAKTVAPTIVDGIRLALSTTGAR